MRAQSRLAYELTEFAQEDDLISLPMLPFFAPAQTASVITVGQN